MPDVRATSGGQGEARGLPYMWRQAGEDGAVGLLLTARTNSASCVSVNA